MRPRTIANSFLLSVLVLPACDLVSGQEIKENFIASGMSQKMGGYRPIRAAMSDDAKGIDKTPEGLTAPKFGKFELDGKTWAFILDEPEDGKAALYIDANQDGDLTNDPQVEWTMRKQGEFSTYNGSAKIELNKGQAGAVGMYRFDPKDPSRAQLKDALMYYIDFGTEFQMQMQSNIQSQQAAAESKAQLVQLEAQSKIQLREAEMNFAVQQMQAEAAIKAQLMDREFQYNMQLKGIETENLMKREEKKEEAKDKRVDLQATRQSELINQRKNNLPPLNFESSEDSLDGFDLESFSPK